MTKSDMKIRWITTTCFEIVLPNGKTLVFDPWTGQEDPKFPGFKIDTGMTVDDFTGADYIFLSHTHFDHVINVGELLEKKCTDPHGGHVFLPALSSKLFSDVYNVPIINLVPVYPYETMYLDDIIATPLPCRHFGDEGMLFDEKPDAARARAMARGTDPKDYECSEMGSLEETDWAITIKETGFRFMILGGRVYRFNNIYHYAEQFHPNFVIRQVSNGATPKAYAEMVAKYHTPLIFPSHHDSHHLEKAQNMSFEEYFSKANEELEALKSPTRIVNIKPVTWYHIGVSCEEG